MKQFEKIPAYLRKPIFEKLFSIAEYTNLTKEEKTMYDNSMKHKWDNKHVLDTAVQEAKLEGKQEGKLEGKLEEAREIARELKKEGLAIEFIAKTTKLSVGEIEKL